jgi:predicted small lipoprotein YifL
MKKLLFGVVALLPLFALSGCGRDSFESLRK